MFGTLCALDEHPHDFTETEIEAMTSLSRFLSHVLDLEQLAQSFQLKSEALSAAANAVAISDASGQIVWVNPAFVSLTGFSLEEICAEKWTLRRVGFEVSDFHQPIWQTITSGHTWHGELMSRHKDGSLYYADMTVTPVLNEAGEITHYISIKQDITERKQTEKELNYLAHYDPLTTLPNRVMFRECLAQALTSAKRHGQMLAVLFLDLDRFKHINEQLGHQAGDQILKETARRIKECVRDNDIVARISGDEFTVILHNVTSSEDVEKILQRIIETIAQPVLVESTPETESCELFISTSIGVSISGFDNADSDTLIKQADIAMHHAKDSGRNRFQFYRPEMNTSSRLELENSLRKALDRDDLILHYQPKVNLATGAIVGMEALVRWQHPELGMISPGIFIPMAEDIGMIGPIGEWVLRTACRQNKAWQDAGLARICVAVNLSVSQFRYGNIVETVRQVLDETGLDPRWLELELTESVIIQDTEKIIAALHALKEMGIQISVDDFGTGYSSLSYLQKLPIDALKIDRSFVQDIKTPWDDGIIPKAVISLAHSLRLLVVAEGVETEAQLECLRAMNCDLMQGYLFSRPLPVHDFELLLNSGRTLYASV